MEVPTATASRWHLPVLLVLTLGLTLYVYAHTDAVTEDSVIFVQYARQLRGEVSGVDHLTPPTRGAWVAAILADLAPWIPGFDVIIRGEQHPGYPLAILATRETVGPWLSTHPVWMWIRAGQCVSVLAALLLTAGLYWLGRHLLGARAALVGCLLLLLTPRFLQIRADVLSDGPGLAFMILSGCFACRLLEGGRIRDALACGVCGAIAYLFRPESMQLAVAAAGMLALRLARVPAARRETALQLSALVLPLVLVCAPYMFVRGSVLTKEARAFTMVDPTLENDAERPPGMLAALLLRCVPEPVVQVARGVRRFVGRWVECAGGLTLLAIGIGLYARRRDLATRPAHQLIWAAIACNLIILPGALYFRKGYLDWRHLLPVAALTVFWAWPGVQAARAWLVERWQQRVPSVRTRALLAAALVGLLLATAVQTDLLGFLQRPLHHERYGQLRAGDWLRKHTKLGRNIADPECLPSFYAGRDVERCWDRNHPPLTEETLERILKNAFPADFLVVSNRYLRNHCCPDGLPETTPSFALHRVKQFRASLKAGDPTRVLIYRVTARATSAR